MIFFVNCLVTWLARGIQGKEVGRGSWYGIQEQGKQSKQLVLSLHHVHTAYTNSYILSMSVVRRSRSCELFFFTEKSGVFFFSLSPPPPPKSVQFVSSYDIL